MKYLLFAFTLFLSLNIAAQELPKKSKIFVRVYNENGEEIAKGKILKITNSTLVLKKGRSSIKVASNEISYLKTKRSNYHNALLGSAGGFGLGLATTSNNKDCYLCADPGRARFVNSLVGAILGYGVGYITTVFKNSKQYIIGGDAQKWQGFKEEMYAPKY
ncbi:MAG: hypothetical protein ACJA1B_001219 [Polaribacter sp.]|jgi:hypothetical protein